MHQRPPHLGWKILRSLAPLLFCSLFSTTVLGQYPAAQGVVDSRVNTVPVVPMGGNIPGVSHTSSVLVVANAAPTTSTSAGYAELQQILRRSIDELDPSSLPDPAAARQALQSAIDDLKRYIKLDSPNGQLWSSFLKLSEIEAELAKDRSSGGRLTALSMNMRQNYLGLEYAPYTRLREALDNMVRATTFGANPDRTVTTLSNLMGDLIEKLDEPEGGSESELNASIGLITNYLVDSGQAPASVAQIRQQFAQPNVQLVARETMLNRIVGRPVAEPGPVNECILGTRILGRACLTGNLLVDVLPMSGGVCLDLQLNGNLNSNNRGYNRGVVLRTTGQSPVLASKQVIATPTGVSSSPATIATNLRTRINRIEHRLRIVRRIARKKAAQQKSQADAIAEYRMRRRLRRQYDEQVDGQLDEANVQLAKLQQGRVELTRLDIPRPAYAIYSTSDTVNANVVQAASFQLAARKPCPIPRPLDADAVVELHQSAAINAAESFLAGRTIRNTDLRGLAKQLLGEVPPELLEEADGPPWEITMASFNPVQIEFDDQRVGVTLRISRMVGSERTVPRSVITATYLPSYYNRVLALKREGDLEVELPSVRSANQATALRSVVRKKFDEIFKEEIVTEQINVAERFPRLAQFDIRSVYLDDGWLQLGIR